MTTPVHLDPARKHDFVFLFDVRDGNPNGDPDAGGAPRTDPDTGQGLVTDVAIKRKIRNTIALLKEGEPGFDIYVEAGVSLNSQHERAYTALDLQGDKTDKKQTVGNQPRARDWMCATFFDVRTFGAVMSTGINCGQVRGPGGDIIWRTHNRRYIKDAERNIKVAEVNRRAGGSRWEWCYAGFGHRPGDWLSTNEHTGNWVMTADGGKLFSEKKRVDGEGRMQQHNETYDLMVNTYDAAPMMYIIPSYAEVELAEELYPDSIFRDDKDRPRTIRPWVVREADWHMMYSYGNSFGDYTHSAIEKIVERSDIAGFAFDCINRALHNYFGPGVERSPGRA
jgi:hypothetical protein